LGYQNENFDVGGACSTYGGEEKSIQDFGRRNLRERDHLKTQIYMRDGSPESGWRGNYGIDRAKVKDTWRAVMSEVMNLGIQ
jgi:hypothetical protein